jgi:hypothetical protein
MAGKLATAEMLSTAGMPAWMKATAENPTTPGTQAKTENPAPVTTSETM